MVQACDLSIQETEQEDPEFKASLNYKVKCQQNNNDKSNPSASFQKGHFFFLFFPFLFVVLRFNREAFSLPGRCLIVSHILSL